MDCQVVAVIVSPDEFVSGRDASRDFGTLVDWLEAGEIAKAVVVYRNKPRAVVLSIAAYETLFLAAARGGEAT